MTKIFVSYTRKDSRFAKRIVNYLRRAADEDTIVFYDRDIPGGTPWWNKILKEIEKADLFIYLVSNKSLASPYCLAEMQEAMRLGKRFLPVMIHSNVSIDRAPKEIAKAIHDAQRIYLSKGLNTARVADLQRGISSSLKGEERLFQLQPGTEPTPEPAVKDKPSIIEKLFYLLQWGAGIATILAVPSAVLAVYTFMISKPGNDLPTPIPTQVAVLLTEETTEVVTESPTATEQPSLIPTRTRTPTATNTPSATPELQTQIAMEFTQTKIAGNDFASATAARWTYTPSDTPTPTDTLTTTPDYTQTYEKARDDFAASLTAENWTDTPTATFTPTITLTSTLTEPEKALKQAEEGVTANDEWIPYSEIINGKEMVLVPAGCFMMGSANGEDNEKPVHEQCFDEPFWIDRTEVTRAMYQVCVDAGICVAKSINQYSEDSNQPINNVNWFQARDYCEWRRSRLPTEREWEYAARGPDNWVYSWGNNFAEANVVYEDNSGKQTAPVGSRPEGASWVGALDMSGNVWEWVSSLYNAYPYTSRSESQTDNNSLRGLRGGSFSSDDNLVRTVYRYSLSPISEYSFFGFRCSLSYKGE